MLHNNNHIGARPYGLRLEYMKLSDTTLSLQILFFVQIIKPPLCLTFTTPLCRLFAYSYNMYIYRHVPVYFICLANGFPCYYFFSYSNFHALLFMFFCGKLALLHLYVATIYIQRQMKKLTYSCVNHVCKCTIADTQKYICHVVCLLIMAYIQINTQYIRISKPITQVQQFNAAN